MAQAPQAGRPGPRLSPRAQNVYQRIFMAAMKIIYDKNITPQLIQMVRVAGDPVAGIAKATMVVADTLAERIKGVNPAALYQGPILMAIAIQIAALAVKAGLIEDSMKKLVPPLSAALKAEIAGRRTGIRQPAAGAAPQMPAAAGMIDSGV